MKVAITYAYSLYMGGAERVLEVLAETFPEADFFCLLVSPEFIPPALKGRQITTSFLNKLPFMKRHHRLFFALYPLAVESLNLRGYDLVISSDGMATKGVITDEGACHICYCHSPHRSLWDQYSHYMSTLGGLKKALFTLSAHYVRQWDFNSAQRIDTFIANSQFIAERIRKYYRRESIVIYPPVNTSGGFLANRAGDYYFTAGRLTGIKRTDLIVQACTALGRKLLVAGTGEDLPRLQRMAGPTVEFLGHVDEASLRTLYSECRAFLFAAKEDFGIAPVEAQSYGRPVIAFGQGGALESIIEQKGCTGESSGLFFYAQSAPALADAILEFERREHEYSPAFIRSHSLQFDRDVFVQRMREIASMVVSRDPVEV